MSLIAGIIGSFVAILCFALLLECPRRYLPLAGIVGAAGGGVYLFCVRCGLGTVFSSFLSSLIIAFMSHMFARIFKAPVTVFLIPGILPTVPGAGMYRTVYYILEGKRSMSAYYLTQTLEIAGMIALAIFIADTFFKLITKFAKTDNLEKTEEK